MNLGERGKGRGSLLCQASDGREQAFLSGGKDPLDKERDLGVVFHPNRTTVQEFAKRD